MAEAAVIGGGVSGLGAALILARLGHEVTVLEKSPRPGALVRGFRRGGLQFETAFHYAGGLGAGAPLYRYLDRLGLFRQGLAVRPLREPGGETLRLAGEDLPVPASRRALRELLPAGPELDAFFRDSYDIFQRSPYLNPALEDFDSRNLYSEGPSLAARLAALPLADRWKSLLGFRCLLYGVRPSEAYFNHFALVNEPYLDGGHSFEGGGQALIAAFEKALAEAGVKVLAGREVTAIRVDGANGVRSVAFSESGGEAELDCRLCIHSGSPAALPRLLPPGALRPVLARRLAQMQLTAPPFLLFARAGTDWLAGRQLFLAPDERLEGWLETGRGGFRQTSPLIYLSGGSEGRGGRWPLSAVSLLPAGATDPWAASRAGQRPAAYLDFKEKEAARLKALILAACPELGGEMEIVDSATDLSFENYSLDFGRGIYGKLNSLEQAPILPLTRVGGLALAGQNIVLPGLLGGLVSSALAVGCLLGHKPVLELLRG